MPHGSHSAPFGHQGGCFLGGSLCVRASGPGERCTVPTPRCLHTHGAPENTTETRRTAAELQRSASSAHTAGLAPSSSSTSLVPSRLSGQAGGQAWPPAYGDSRNHHARAPRRPAAWVLPPCVTWIERSCKSNTQPSHSPTEPVVSYAQPVAVDPGYHQRQLKNTPAAPNTSRKSTTRPSSRLARHWTRRQPDREAGFWWFFR